MSTNLQVHHIYTVISSTYFWLFLAIDSNLKFFIYSKYLTKNSSLAIAIGYMDLVATLGGITLNQTGREIETMLMVMGMYLAISLAISMGMNWYNSSVKLVDR